MTTVDAQTYWMSAKIPNDQFLLYGFDGVPADARAGAGRRPRARPALPGAVGCVRRRRPLTYPAWVHGGVDASQFVVHDLDDTSWAGCLAAVGALADDQLDARG